MSFQMPSSRYVLPSFVERTSYGMKESNPYNKLFEERIIFLGTPVDDQIDCDAWPFFPETGQQRAHLNQVAHPGDVNDQNLFHSCISHTRHSCKPCDPFRIS